jgi:hypothetical protein
MSLLRPLYHPTGVHLQAMTPTCRRLFPATLFPLVRGVPCPRGRRMACSVRRSAPLLALARELSHCPALVGARSHFQAVAWLRATAPP